MSGAIRGALLAVAAILIVVGVLGNTNYIVLSGAQPNLSSCNSSTYTLSKTPSGAPLCYSWSITQPNPTLTPLSWTIQLNGFIWPSTVTWGASTYLPVITITGATLTLLTSPPQVVNLTNGQNNGHPISQGSCILASVGGPISYCPFTIIDYLNVTAIKAPVASGNYNATIGVTYSVSCPFSIKSCPFSSGTAVTQGVQLFVAKNSAGYGPQIVQNFKASPAGLRVTFQDQSFYNLGSISTPNWQFGDGTTGTGLFTNHSYSAAGSYTVVERYVYNTSAFGVQPYLVSGAMLVNVTVVQSSNNTTSFSLPSVSAISTHAFSWPPSAPAFGLILAGVGVVAVVVIPYLLRNPAWAIIVVVGLGALGYVAGVIW